KDGVLLAGERKVLKIEGFALGNSPVEMTPAAVAGKTLVLTTTNGPPALVAAQGRAPALVGAPANFKALAARARAVLAERGELIIVCAGRDKQFALEDAYAAGRLIKAIRKGLRKLALNDAALAALALTQQFATWVEALEQSEAARQLTEADLAGDVAYSAQADRFAAPPAAARRRGRAGPPTARPRPTPRSSSACSPPCSPPPCIGPWARQAAYSSACSRCRPSESLRSGGTRSSL